MICSNCFETEFKTVKKPYEVFINGEVKCFEDVEREECPACGYSLFTQSQAIDLDKKRIIEEFGTKPILTPFQLRMLRLILDLTLDQISDMLHIGKNTYGRWERGEVTITPSMNLLVHNFIEKMPVAKVNLIDSFMSKEIASAKTKILASDKNVSFGKYINFIFSKTGIRPSIVCQKIDLREEDLRRIETNSIDITKVESRKVYLIAKLLKLSFSELAKMLIKSFEIFNFSDDVSFMHARIVDNTRPMIKEEEDSIAEILEAVSGLDKKEVSPKINMSAIEKYTEEIRQLYDKNIDLPEA